MCRAKTCVVHLWLNVHACESNKTELEMKKKQKTKKTNKTKQNRVLTHFRSIERRLHAVCMNIYTHCPKT